MFNIIFFIELLKDEEIGSFTYGKSFSNSCYNIFGHRRFILLRIVIYNNNKSLQYFLSMNGEIAKFKKEMGFLFLFEKIKHP